MDTSPQEIRIADWGIEVAFIGTRVGKELEVSRSLVDQEPKCTCFGTYGYFDLAAIRCIDHLNSPYLVLLHADITESAPFRFFTDSVTSREEFEGALHSWPAAVAVIVKIHPGANMQRWEVATRIRAQWKDPYIFFGLGFSELLLLSGGEDISAALRQVSAIRGFVEPSSSQTIFSKTTTFPFVSTTILNDKNFSALKGEVEPVITVSCGPSCERNIAAELEPQQIISKNIYGKNDLLLAWNEAIAVADLVQFLTGFRDKWGKAAAITKTTTYLETRVSEVPSTSLPSPILQKDVLAVDDQEALFSQIRQVQPAWLRAALSDLTLRLLACLRDPHLTEYYRDMLNTFRFVSDLLEHLTKDEASIAAEKEAVASRVATIARIAINQRYAGLELHPETLAHSHSPLLCDIRTIVAAATCLPHYIFNNLFLKTRADDTWAGFVLFGGAFSPQWFDQDVLALPPASLFRPVEEWWKITHEAAHAVYQILRVNESLDPEIYDYIKEADANSDLSAYHIIGEQFANWFDWKYVFHRNSSFYLELVWNAWVKFPMVRQSSAQYLSRTFALLLCEDQAALTEVSLQSMDDGVIPLLNRRWKDFLNLVKPVQAIVEIIESADQKEVFGMVSSLLPLLRWFEQRFEASCNVVGLAERLSPRYERLDKDVESLKAGKVLTERIIDPLRLHLALLETLEGRTPSLSTEIAYIYSLEGTYFANRQS